MNFPNSKNFKNILLDSFNEKKATISIVGLGYVGLPLALTFIKAGYKVVGIDNDENKINSINNGESYLHHIRNSQIKSAKKNNLFNAYSDPSKVSQANAIILCVPTPLNRYREPDLSYILNTMKSLKPYLKEGQILSLESTTYPGTTEEKLLPIIDECGLRVGENFFLIYSPEREDPGNKDYNTETIPKVIGGITPSCTEIGIALYQNAIKEIVPVSSTRTAEMTKLLENIHRAVNIGLMNELKPLADRMGIDLYEVIKAASTKPFGFVPYFPGPGLGGHCIPIDPFYLTWKAREFEMHTRFIELAGEINTAMPSYVVQKTAEALNKVAKSVNRSKILLCGITYKKNIADMRESPSVKIMEILINKGANVQFTDPFFTKFPKMREYSFDLKSITINANNLKSFDVVIISTDHDSFNYELIQKYSSLIIDTRGRYLTSENVIRA